LPALPWTSTGRARRNLTRGIRSFPATLPSSHPGIFFTARIAGRISEPVGYSQDPVHLATAIRRALRKAARDVTCHASPADLAEATDMCNQRLAVPLPVPSRANVSVRAAVTLSEGYSKPVAPASLKSLSAGSCRPAFISIEIADNGLPGR
jgi:hypothetical protein